MFRAILQLCKGLLQVCDKIVNVFDADAQPDKVIGDPDLAALVFGYRGVGHERRVVRQRLDSAKGFGQGKNANLFKKADRVGFKILENGDKVRVFKSNGEAVGA